MPCQWREPQTWLGSPSCQLASFICHKGLFLVWETWSSDPSDLWRQRNDCSFMLSIQHIDHEEPGTSLSHPIVPRFYDNIYQQASLIQIYIYVNFKIRTVSKDSSLCWKVMFISNKYQREAVSPAKMMLKDSHLVHLNNLDSRWLIIYSLSWIFLKLILTQVSLSRSLKQRVCPQIMKAHHRILIPNCPEIGKVREG